MWLGESFHKSQNLYERSNLLHIVCRLKVIKRHSASSRYINCVLQWFMISTSHIRLFGRLMFSSQFVVENMIPHDFHWCFFCFQVTYFRGSHESTVKLFDKCQDFCLGVVHKWSHGLGGCGQWICDDIIYLRAKNHDDWEIFQIFLNRRLIYAYRRYRSMWMWSLWHPLLSM